MNPTSHTRRRLAALLITLLAGVVLAACGSSSSTTTTSTTRTSASAAASSGSASTRRTALRQCLAAHGVTLPARPPGNRRPNGGGGPGAGGGLFFGGGGGANRFANNPKLAAAFRACGGTAFRGGGRRFQLSHTAITNFVACVRRHGYPAMPEPNFSGKGPVFPASIRTNKQFLSASKPCANLLVRPRPSAAASGA